MQWASLQGGSLRGACFACLPRSSAPSSVIASWRRRPGAHWLGRAERAVGQVAAQGQEQLVSPPGPFPVARHILTEPRPCLCVSWPTGGGLQSCPRLWGSWCCQPFCAHRLRCWSSCWWWDCGRRRLWSSVFSWPSTHWGLGLGRGPQLDMLPWGSLMRPEAGWWDLGQGRSRVGVAAGQGCSWGRQHHVLAPATSSTPAAMGTTRGSASASTLQPPARGAQGGAAALTPVGAGR